MAQTLVKQNERLGTFLRALMAEVQELPNLEQEWANLNNDQRAIVWLDWDHLVADYLTELDEAYDNGEMTDNQATDYKKLLAEIEIKLPIFARLDLRRPRLRLPQ